MEIKEKAIAGLTCLVAEPDQKSEKKTIVCIHGLWGGAWQFENWMHYLAKNGYGAVVVNLPGRLGSGNQESPSQLSVMDYTRALQKVLHELGSSIVIGHALGGLIVQKIIEQTPNLIDRAILVASEPPRGIFIRGQVWWRMLCLYSQGQFIPYIRAVLSGNAFYARPVDIKALFLNKMDDSNHFLAKFTADSGRAAFEIALQRISVENCLSEKVPMLVVNGSDDKAMPPSVNRKIAKKHKAEYRVYNGSGHMLMLEHGWEKIISDILAWIES